MGLLTVQKMAATIIIMPIAEISFLYFNIKFLTSIKFITPLYSLWQAHCHYVQDLRALRLDLFTITRYTILNKSGNDIMTDKVIDMENIPYEIERK